MKTRFFRCDTCGNVIVKVVDSNVPVECCNSMMEPLVPKTTDGGGEKHLPVITRISDNSVTVTIGSVEHPMTHDHFIKFICLETSKGMQIVYLSPDDKPSATFYYGDTKPIAVYEYCNLHGLWKTDIN